MNINLLQRMLQKSKPLQPDQRTIKYIEIHQDPVSLYKILKFEGVVSSGAEAKIAVANGQLLVNDKIETRKRRKIKAGDVIEFLDEQFSIRLMRR